MTQPDGRPAPRARRRAALRIDALPYPALALDDDGVILAVNPPLARILGERGGVAGRRLTDVVRGAASRRAAAALPERGDDARARTRLFLAGPERGAHAITFDVVRDGTTTWLVAPGAGRAVPRTPGRARRATHADAPASHVVHTMSHELRTPLNAIVGYAGLLRDGVYGALTDMQMRAVGALLRRARDLQALIDEMLELTSLELGTIALRSQPFDPRAVLEEVADAVAPMATPKSITIAVEGASPRAVRGDPQRYRQIVLHLATNAVKFTPPGGTVTLSLHRLGATRFATEVRDTGIGIARADLQRIFDVFEQVESGPTRRYPGIGLGLALVRRLVGRLGGRVSVESRPARGTRFTVVLPVVPATGAPGVPGVARLADAEVPSGPPELADGAPAAASR